MSTTYAFSSPNMFFCDNPETHVSFFSPYTSLAVTVTCSTQWRNQEGPGWALRPPRDVIFLGNSSWGTFLQNGWDIFAKLGDIFCKIGGNCTILQWLRCIRKTLLSVAMICDNCAKNYSNSILRQHSTWIFLLLNMLYSIKMYSNKNKARAQNPGHAVG